ncbi:MAG: sulfate ABC transporter permease subunit [Deltaproteobacteria bacterium]|nr:sulfate ABC transporter permease subunit [Deltaproteobacteria bacterium]
MSRPRNMDSLLRGATFAAALGLFFLLILLPLVSLNQYAVREGFGVFWDRLKNPDAVAALRLTGLVALATTGVNGVIGTAMAFLLTRYRFPGRKAINALVDIPLAIPTVVTGFALLLMYGPLGPVGRFFGEREIQIMFSFPGLLLGHVFVTFPFMVRAVGAVLESVPRSGEDAARTLGAKEWQVFAFVTIPAVREGIVAGAFLTFSRSLGEFGASIMVSGNLVGRTQTGPLYIFSRFNTGDVEGAAAIAILLALASFLILLLLQLFQSSVARKVG